VDPLASPELASAGIVVTCGDRSSRQAIVRITDV
jgi:hypothetical protein